MLGAFVLETGVDILSRARVRVTHCAFLRHSPQSAERARRRAMCSFSRRENAKTLAPLLVPQELSRCSLIFTPQGEGVTPSRSHAFAGHKLLTVVRDVKQQPAVRSAPWPDTVNYAHRRIIKQKAHTVV